jgi:hypothetical protein
MGKVVVAKMGKVVMARRPPTARVRDGVTALNVNRLVDKEGNMDEVVNNGNIVVSSSQGRMKVMIGAPTKATRANVRAANNAVDSVGERVGDMVDVGSTVLKADNTVVNGGTIEAEKVDRELRIDVVRDGVIELKNRIPSTEILVSVKVGAVRLPNIEVKDTVLDDVTPKMENKSKARIASMAVEVMDIVGHQERLATVEPSVANVLRGI